MAYRFKTKAIPKDESRTDGLKALGNVSTPGGPGLKILHTGFA